jgi:hypothetical protein
MVCVHNIGIFVNKAHAYFFFFKIIAINIFKVNNFHLLIEIIPQSIKVTNFHTSGIHV